MEVDRNFFVVGELADQKLGEKLVSDLKNKDIEAALLKHETQDIYALAVFHEENQKEAFDMYRVALGMPGAPPEPDERWLKIKGLKIGPLTKFLILVCIGLFILIHYFDKDENIIKSLLIATPNSFFFEEIRNGQYWRLFTPALLHFSFLHILFNLMWLKDLGTLIERSKGLQFYLFFLLITAGVSNYFQYAMHGLHFGGMSGVVFALLGYLWTHKLAHPSYDFEIPKKDFYFILIWYVLCLSGVVGKIANIAHGVGLVSGVILGLFPLRGIVIKQKLILSVLVSFSLLLITFFIER